MSATGVPCKQNRIKHRSKSNVIPFKTPLPLRPISTIWDSILLALASMHAQGLCHGHVTPGRILFTSPSRNEEGAATAKLCFLDNIRGGTGTASGYEKDMRFD